MTQTPIKGIHRVKKKLSGGRKVEYHYAWRGGPRFWSSEDAIQAGSASYWAAWHKVVEGREPDTGQFRQIIRAYLKSRDYTSLSPRTKSDYSKQIVQIDAEFGDAPVGVFNRREIRKIVYAWRDTFKGERSADLHKGLLVTIVNWAVDRGYLDNNYLAGMSNLYSSSRAEIIWTLDEIDLFCDGDTEKDISPAPAWLARILIVATETGLRPGDMIRLSRNHFKTTPTGQRIQIKTNKRQRIVSIPVTKGMARVLAETPRDQMMILVGEKGQPFTKSPSLGQAVQRRRDKCGIRKELRLYDARGTAVTRLFEVGATLRELALQMGWSLPYAANMLQTYAAMNPESADAILVKLDAAEKGAEKGTSL